MLFICTLIKRQYPKLSQKMYRLILSGLITKKLKRRGGDSSKLIQYTQVKQVLGSIFWCPSIESIHLYQEFTLLELRGVFMRNFVKYFIVNTLCIISIANAYAGTITCSGTVDFLSYHANIGLMLKLSSMNTQVFICNPDAEWNVPGTTYITSPGACKALYSTFLSARVTGQPINSMYFDGDAVPATCNSWGNWQRANIRFYTF